MKRIAIALLVSAAALAATTARADTRVSINIGAPVYRPAPPAVVYAPAPPPVVAYVPAPRGYWKEIVVKTWVPERWVSSRDRWGRHVRVCEPGYYAYRTDRVWVDGRDGRRDDDRRDYGRRDDDRRYGHDYDRSRDHRYSWNR
jgi:hypothetical protein